MNLTEFLIYLNNQFLVALAFSTSELVEEKLKKIRTWDYPLNQSLARCKHGTAIALSFHFQGKQARGSSDVSNTIMGLSLARFTREIEQFIKLYQWIAKAGEEQKNIGI